MRRSWCPLLALSLIVVLLSAACGCTPDRGIITSQPAQASPLNDSVQMKPIITTGDKLSEAYTMAATPDGLGATDNGDDTFSVLMNHELKENQNLTNSRVSKLEIDKKTLRVLKGSYLIKGTEGYRRLCSATMVGRRENFGEDLFLTGEEDTGGMHNGVAIALHPKTGEITELPWLGYMKHENVIDLPSFGKIVTLTTDDDAPGYLYMYIADNQGDFLTGKGQLYVFVANTGQTPEAISKTQPTMGRFVLLNPLENTNAQRLKDAADAKGAMVFTRLEDLAYDVDANGLFYFDTTGDSEFSKPGTNKPYDVKGRLYAMQLDPNDPTNVQSLQVLLDGNARDDILNPDNIATSHESIMIQEDPNDEFQKGHAGRVLRYDLKNHTLTPVAVIVQRDDAGNEIPNGKLGSWETSGIINMVDILGPNQWLMVTQADTLHVLQFGGTDKGGQLMRLTVPESASKK